MSGHIRSVPARSLHQILPSKKEEEGEVAEGNQLMARPRQDGDHRRCVPSFLRLRGPGRLTASCDSAVRTPSCWGSACPSPGRRASLGPSATAASSCATAHSRPPRRPPRCGRSSWMPGRKPDQRWRGFGATSPGRT